MGLPWNCLVYMSGISSLICLESDNESESSAKRENEEDNETLLDFDSDVGNDSELSGQFLNPRTFPGKLMLLARYSFMLWFDV